MEDKEFIALAKKVFKKDEFIHGITFYYNGDIMIKWMHKEPLESNFRIPIYISKHNPDVVYWNNKPASFNHIYIENGEDI